VAKLLGGCSATPKEKMGVALATPMGHGGGLATPKPTKGVAHTPFLLFCFFFFFMLLSFFKYIYIWR
jgi:hypothetical protein